MLRRAVLCQPRHRRAKKLLDNRKAEMDQTLTQMNDRTEQLERVAAEKEAASKKLEKMREQLAVS